MDEQYNNKSEKETVEEIYGNTFIEMGLTGYASFGGYYNEDSNSRARSYGNKTYINEKFLNINQAEHQRASFHEGQHILNSKRYEEVDDETAKALYAFVLHPNFKDLHDRMEQVFMHYKQQSYPFIKIVSPLVTKYTKIGMANDSYTHPDEVLALLKGYACYLRQKELEKDVSTEPYEFIEAFQPSDLDFLSEVYRLQLATEVIQRDPHALDVPIETPLVFAKKSQ